MAKAGRIFFPLDVNWYEEWGHLLSNDACTLWMTAACAGKRLTSDGKLTIAQLRRIAPISLQQSQVDFSNVLSELDALPEAPLTLTDDGVVIHGWSDWHPSSLEIASNSASLTRDGIFGNHVKWHVQKKQKPKTPCVYCEEDSLESGGRVGSANRKSRVEKSIYRGDNKFLEDFETVWEHYPRKEYKKAASDAYVARRNQETSAEDLLTATKNYEKQMTAEQRDQGFIMLGSTFYGPKERWKQHLTAFVEKPAFSSGSMGHS